MAGQSSMLGSIDQKSIIAVLGKGSEFSVRIPLKS